jgi:transcriptional regulator with XRE-family HTH domain
MNSFKKEKILEDNEVIAETLKKRRKEKKISAKEASLKLKINLKYIKALETGAFGKLPEGVYGRNFLKEYACFLGLDLKKILELYDGSALSEKEDCKRLFSNQIVKARSFLIMPKIFKSILIFFIALACLSYLGFYIHKIISPPNLYIYEPKDNFITENNYINVLGSVEAEAEIIINGDPVSLKEDGGFIKKIDLKKGINTIVVKAKKKYSKEVVIIKQVIKD